MTTNPIIPLPDALRKAEAVSTSGEYEQFLEGVREKNPRRFQSDSRVIERDYLRIVDHHLRNLIPLVQRYIGSNVRRVLDFGCGSGGSAIALAMVFPQIRCFGTDVDADEVDVALKRAKLYGGARALPDLFRSARKMSPCLTQMLRLISVCVRPFWNM